MKFDRILITSSLIVCLSLYSASKPSSMITIVHSHIFPKYYQLISKLSQTSSIPFSRISEDEAPTAEELCKARVKAKFFIPEGMDTQVAEIDHKAVVSKIKNFYDDNKAESPSGLIRRISVWSKQTQKYYNFNVIPCFMKNGGESWYIADIFNSGTYYAITVKYENGYKKGYTTLDGLLEPIPFISERLSNSQNELEKAFLAGLRDSTNEGSRPKHNIEDLHPFDITRICSGIFVMWSKKKRNSASEPLAELNYVRTAKGFNEKQLLMDVTIHLQTVPALIEADLIACYLSTENSKKPLFYMAMDVVTVGGVYVIEENSVDIFSIFMHVTEVIALMQKE